MRTDSAAFALRNKSDSREPIFVVELSFDAANTDLHFLCSKTVQGLTGNIINETLQGFSSTSQKINPEKALSTIGSISFECLDIGLTELQRTKLQSGNGLKGKRVRVYKGFLGLDWADYALIQTQVISDSVSFKDGVYSFQCADVQRQLRKTIFEVKETSLSSSISRTATTIPVYDTSQFEMVKQPTSPSGITDAPNQTVGYLKIEDGDDVEIIRYTGKTSGAFTGCTRGVLGTRSLDITVNASEADKSKKITEYVYLEMAAPKLIYALLTGVIYGQAETLPDHWHLGIASNFIKTSDFITIGSDWWDLSNNDKGVPAVIRGVEKEDGKKFIEEELLIMLGAYMPIYSSGEVGLKRMVSVLSEGGYDRELNQDNVINYGELKHDLSAVINQIVISWNYIESRKGFTRRSILIDPDSIQKNGKSEPLELKLRALETSRHSYSTIKSRFDSLRDRFAGAPLRLQLTLAPTENDLEIGDVVRVNLPQIEDYTKSGSGLNRNFEVQRISQDWIKGQVRVDLFGSTATASPVPEDEVVGGVVVENSFYNSAGTEISPANFGSAVTDSGGTTTITGTITLNGSSDVNSSSSIFYCNQDLTLNAGAKIIINGNVQIRVKGFFQVNGTIDGKGRGYAGGAGVSTGIETSRDWPGIYRNSNYDAYSSANYGTRGFIDPTLMPQGGGVITATGNSSTPYRLSLYPDQDGRIKYGGVRNYAPQLDLKIEGNSLLGLPSDLRGTSGIGGGVGVLAWKFSGVWQHSHYGGSNGGASGAGLAIVCGGADIGANGVIDTSGLDAATPGLSSINHPTAGVYCGDFQHPSGSGGACGACYWLIVGSSSTAPTLDAQNSIATMGGGQDYANADDDLYTVIDRTLTISGATARDFRYIFNNAKTCSFYEYSQPFYSSNAFQSCHKIQYVNYAAPVTGATPVYADDATFSLTEYTNTPETTAGDRSTVEVSISSPADETYSYSIIEYRLQGSAAWSRTMPSAFEAMFQVKSDGSTYEVRARSVSTSGKISPTSPIQTITVTDVAGKTDGELANLYPLANVTNLKLQNQSGNVFLGRDIALEWDNDNNDLSYFSHYRVEIETGGVIRRTERSVSPIYVYDSVKNSLDYKTLNGSHGYFYDVTIHVTPISNKINNLGQPYYVGTTKASFAVSASNDADPNNLRFVIEAADAATTADWQNVEGRPTNVLSAEDNSFFDLNGWTPGKVGDLPEFYSRYDSSDNEVVSAITPYGAQEGVVQLSKGTNSSMSLTSYSHDIQHDKTYRCSVWFKVVSGSAEIRPRAYGQFQDGVGNPASQKDFAISSTGFFSIGQWYLWLGHVKASTIPFAQDIPDDGFYAKDGSSPRGNSSDIWLRDAAPGEQNLVFDFWCRSMSSDFAIQLSKPRMEEVNGAEPSLATMLSYDAGSRQTSELFNSRQTWQEVNEIPDHLTEVATTGLNITQGFLGYYDGSAWRSYIDNLGRMYLKGTGGDALSWDGSSLTLSGDTAIALGASTTFGSQGMQFEYNGGNPRAYMGDGVDSFFKYENGVIETGNNVAWRGLDSYNAEGSDFIRGDWSRSEWLTEYQDLGSWDSTGWYVFYGRRNGNKRADCYYQGIPTPSGAGLNPVDYTKHIRFKVKLGGFLTGNDLAYFGFGTGLGNSGVDNANIKYGGQKFIGVLVSSYTGNGFSVRLMAGRNAFQNSTTGATVSAILWSQSNMQFSFEEMEFVYNPDIPSLTLLKDGAVLGSIADANVPISTDDIPQFTVQTRADQVLTGSQDLAFKLGNFALLYHD